MSDGARLPVACLRNVGLRYGKTVALDDISLDVPAGAMVACIGPDGVGKSSLLALVAGARKLQSGQLTVLGGDMRKGSHRRKACPRIAYMPQGLGKNLYSSLSIEENLQFFARLFGQGERQRRQRIDRLTRSTGLYPFLNRPVGQLSGGMKQKLGLCCALIHDPDLLILDEPTTGVDPLSRAQFWRLIDELRNQRPELSVLVATAYMEEARRFDWLVAMDQGRILDAGPPAALLARTGTGSLEAAFIALLPPEVRARSQGFTFVPLPADGPSETAIEAHDLTLRFGDFEAVSRVSFRIRRGEIFGFLGSNGCGKTTTMKMLTGLLPASAGSATVFGEPIEHENIALRRRVGYMSQSFSLYHELTVEQNLVLHARLFQVPEAELDSRVSHMVERFGLANVRTALPDKLPLGIRQRLSLAVAMVHNPELLILDEPTSGVDPIARDQFWRLMQELSREDKVTIFISTHFMNEAERCDRISLMHAGRVLASDTPAAIVAQKQAATLEEAFIDHLLEAGAGEIIETPHAPPVEDLPTPSLGEPSGTSWPARLQRSLMRTWTQTWREMLELQRDPLRATLALAGSLVLMFVIGYGISMDVDNLRFAVLDHDDSALSRNYVLNFRGSTYFVEQPPITNDAELDRRMRSGDVSLVLEIPPHFAQDVAHGRPVQVAAWIDGAMPQRSQTIRGYVQALHAQWVADLVRERTGFTIASPSTVETRYRYNPEVKSMPAMVPAVIPILLLNLPAILTALAVVREKELGSIVNLFVTPTTRLEFLVGKQLPYVMLAMLNFLLMTLAAVTVFEVPVKGNFFTLALASLLFSTFATGMGLLASTVTKSQIAAMFFAMISTMILAVEFSGLLNPVSSLEGAGRLIGNLYPATYMFIISRGVFGKALGFTELAPQFWPLLLSIPVTLLIAMLLLKKQES